MDEEDFAEKMLCETYINLAHHWRNQIAMKEWANEIEARKKREEIDKVKSLNEDIRRRNFNRHKDYFGKI